SKQLTSRQSFNPAKFLVTFQPQAPKPTVPIRTMFHPPTRTALGRIRADTFSYAVFRDNVFRHSPGITPRRKQLSEHAKMRAHRAHHLHLAASDGSCPQHHG